MLYSLARSVLFQLDAESAHHLTLAQLAKRPYLGRFLAPKWTAPKTLSQTIFDLPFAHPIGLAAGLDKDAIAIDGLFRCGFSSVEVGTVTPLPQPGNPKPRLFRLKADRALINRMGFNNEGGEACARHVNHRRNKSLTTKFGPVGINIGKNKQTDNRLANEDYASVLEMVIDAADYITVNISSPNTPQLRDLQTAETILQLLRRLAPTLTAKDKPVFIKLSPDLNDDEIVDISHGLYRESPVRQVGIIATNTTVSRDGLTSSAKSESGGLSGRPLQSRSTHVIRLIYQATQGQIPIIGCGGIFTADDAYEKILAGASLLQIYTSFIYAGPAVIRNISLGIASKLGADGFSHISQAVGKGLL